MPKEIIPIDPQLVTNLRTAKANLAAAQQVVEDAESAIYLAAQPHIKEKGTIYVTGIKIVTGFYEKWDQGQLTEIERTWARKSNLPFPFKKEFKADTKSITYIRENASEAYDALVPALSLTPKKPAFSFIEEKSEG